MKQTVVFFGSGNHAIPIVEMLKKHGLSLIVSTEKEGPFRSYLQKQNVDYFISDVKKREDVIAIRAVMPTIGVLASYGAIIPKTVLELFPEGILNIHPSLLPKYKGASPVQSAILAGEAETGVTIIKLDELLDHGPIALQKKVPLTGTETAGELKRTLFAIGADLTLKLLTQHESGKKITFTPQNHTQESFTEKITRSNGFLNLNDLPQKQAVERMIRAYYPWPGVWTQYELAGGKKRIKLLPQNRIQVEGKRIMSLREFANGYQQAGRNLLSKLQLSAF